MSDFVIMGIVSGILTLLGTIFTGVMAYFMARLDRKAGAAAVEVKEVKTTLLHTVANTKLKLDAIAEVGEKTHTLVNSNMGAQLKLTAAVSRRLATLNKDQPSAKEDEAAAELAERLLAEHEAKQHAVDKAEAKK